jgi:four helix bundle protein
LNVERLPTKRFRDLIVWRKVHEFVVKVYCYINGFPKSETYGLSMQTKRAAVSIPANIAEEFKRSGKADKARFINIATGPLEENRYYLILTADLNYSKTDILIKSLEEVSKPLHAYSRAILTPDS